MASLLEDLLSEINDLKESNENLKQISDQLKQGQSQLKEMIDSLNADKDNWVRRECEDLSIFHRRHHSHSKGTKIRSRSSRRENSKSSKSFGTKIV